MWAKQEGGAERVAEERGWSVRASAGGAVFGTQIRAQWGRAALGGRAETHLDTYAVS